MRLTPNYSTLKSDMATPALRALLVDSPTAPAVAAVLEAAGIFVTPVGSFDAAREKLLADNNAFDLLVANLALPGGGQEFLRWLNEAAAPLVLVVTGAKNEAVEAIDSLNFGACDYLVRPWQAPRLAVLLRNVWQRQQKVGFDLQAVRVNRNAAGWFEFTAKSDLEYLRRIQRFCEPLLANQFNLEKDLLNKLNLALEEFGRNAVEWGNKFERDKLFQVSVGLLPDRVVMKFTDEGCGFEPDAQPDPTVNPLAHFQQRQDNGKRPGGFGLHMMRNLLDDITYNEQGNACVLTKLIPAANKQKAL